MTVQSSSTNSQKQQEEEQQQQQQQTHSTVTTFTSPSPPQTEPSPSTSPTRNNLCVSNFHSSTSTASQSIINTASTQRNTNLPTFNNNNIHRYSNSNNTTYFSQRNNFQRPPLPMSTVTTANLGHVPRLPTLPSHLPSALDHLEGLIQTWVRERRRVVFFLDYDGTLSPIVDDPDRATIPQATRDALSIVASRFTTAIVSGRSLEKVMSMVRLNQLIYAGSHGFDIKGPKGQIAHRVASDFLPQLLAAKQDLLQLVPKFPGSSVEDNLLSISFHYRKVDTSLHAECHPCVKRIAEKHGLVLTNGKMVLEVRPLFDWHKGKAVEYLLQVLKLMGPEVVPIYIGDDVTDEDAFKVLNGRGGISVIVADSSLSRNTYADMRLNDPIEVQRFLKHFAEDTRLSALSFASD